MKKFVPFLLPLFCYLLNYSTVIAQKKPNVIFIGVDDMSIAFDAFGNNDAPAPNFGRLLQHGMFFKQAYCQYAICNPSRTSLLSGKRPDATGVTANQTSMRTILGASYKFLPEYFRANSYHTERFGKVSCDHEDELTWDNVFDIQAKHFKVAGTPIWWIDTVSRNVQQTVTGQLTDELVTRLRQPSAAPFFYALGLSTHNPYTPVLSSWNRTGDNTELRLLPVDNNGTITNVQGYGSANIALPATPSDDTADIPEIAINSELLYYTDAEWKDFRHAYYAEVTEMDDHLGVLLDELDRLNIWDSTIVVFFADHGIHLGEHQGLWLKKTLFEESLRVPFVICAPGKAAGVCNKPVELVDIFSTLTELCGLPTAPGQEGASLVPLLDNPDTDWKKAIFSQVTRPVSRGNLIEARAVRTNNFHYNNWLGNGEELYDIQNDPYEYTNLVTNAAYADTLTKMRTIFAEGWTKYVPQRVFYKDEDGDGFGKLTDTVHNFNVPAGYAADSTDCNDANAAIHPGAVELCNGIDDNCNGQIDEGNACVTDRDEDGYTVEQGDCNDSSAAVNPGATEVCNGIDDNCNGQIDEGVQTTFYRDSDGDGYGSSSNTIVACSVPAGYVTNQGDCSDNNATVHPGATEVCNGIDDNCNGQIDENALNAVISPSGSVGICGGASVTLTANSGSGIGYQWLKNGVAISNATHRNYTAKQEGSYQVSESTTAGCSSTSAATTITLSDAPRATIKALGSLNICSTGSVVLQANDGTGYTYQWKKNSVNIGGATGRTYTATATGNYTVAVTNSNSCSKTSKGVDVINSCAAAIVSVKTSGDLFVTSDSLSLNPNPSKGSPELTYIATIKGKVELKVYDVSGRLLFKKADVAVKGVNKYALRLEHFVSGVYYLELRKGNTIGRKKFVISK